MIYINTHPEKPNERLQEVIREMRDAVAMSREAADKERWKYRQAVLKLRRSIPIAILALCLSGCATTPQTAAAKPVAAIPVTAQMGAVNLRTCALIIEAGTPFNWHRHGETMQASMTALERWRDGR